MELPVSIGNAIPNNIMILIAQPTTNPPCPAVKNANIESTERTPRDTFSVGKSVGI